MAIFTMLPRYLFSVLSCIFYAAVRPKVSALVQERLWFRIDRRQLSHQSTIHHTWGSTVHVIFVSYYSHNVLCSSNMQLTEFEVSNIIALFS